jgi:hypothetical protein
MDFSNASRSDSDSFSNFFTNTSPALSIT